MSQLLLRFAFMYPMITLISYAAIIQNPDFELAPTNITSNTTSPFLLTEQANTLPGWSFHGTVRYVTVANGHAIQLGQNGRINQTFKTTGNSMNYVITFTLAVDRVDCMANNNSFALNISTSESFKVFRFLGLYGNRTWESRAFQFTNMDIIHLQIQKVSIGSSNTSCDPIVDSFLIKGVGPEIFYDGMYILGLSANTFCLCL
ncbi:uncharacterized protein LOC124925265 [Impatiens glandulifera]|uniref:uncharacterized protein LOC124925265 n=1 Tax=Impatiens glandulifera TaxID=253017 RepID=UPI001FB17709|nr:uncharacterized protein LOC124925265 [Impatiens glandulifera]